MGRFVFALILAGCASHAASGPAWPKESHTGNDGGESIAPRVIRPVEAAVDKTEEEAKPAPVAPVVEKPAAPVAPKETPAAGAPAAPAAEEAITTEDIVIEINDD